MDEHVPPALVLGCNTPHGIGVLSDWIEERTGQAPDFGATGWSDDRHYFDNNFGYNYGINDGDGDGDGDGFGDGNGDGNGAGCGCGNAYGDGRGIGDGFGMDDDSGYGG